MRTLLASALVLLACGCADRSSRPSGADATPRIPGGPDAVILRVPRTGGRLVAYAYPSIDSVLWRSSQRSPALSRVIAFGPDDGYFAALDTNGAPVRADLRLGTIATASGGAPISVGSYDGGDIYSITGSGQLTRFSPSGGNWTAKPLLPAAALLPQQDGSLIVVGARDDRVIVWRVRPPNDTLSDSVSIVGDADQSLGATVASTAVTVGDRVYVGGTERLLGFTSRDLTKVLDVDVGDPVNAIAFTPSGDRAFVALKETSRLKIIDRFENDVSGKVSLPGEALDLRMDPLGRLLLVRGAGNDVWVVSVAEGTVEGTLKTDWRPDLPMVMADGRIALTRGNDVVLVNGMTLADDRTIPKGANDFWYAIRWNGFRPRSASLDTPVRFPGSTRPDSVDTLSTGSLVDTGTALRSSSSNVGTPPRPPVTAPPVVSAPPARPPAEPPPAVRKPLPSRRTQSSGASTSTARSTARADRNAMFTVSFAAVLNERQARDLAAKIRVNGKSPRVVTSQASRRVIYRVIMGPYSTREEAERIGRASRHDFWVYRGAP